MNRHPSLLAAAALSTLTVSAFAHSSEEHKLLASDGSSGDNFGTSVDVHAGDVVVGAPGADPLAPNSGAAYVFVKNGSSYVEQVKLVPSTGLDGDLFGTAVAIDQDTIVVGAPGTAPAITGSAYVFTRSGTVWSQQAELTSSGSIAGDLFGTAVDVEGDTVIVGAPGTGNAFVFLRTGTAWAEQGELTASDGVAENKFGAAVSLGSDVAIVGAPSQTGVQPTTGAAYVYSRTGIVWSQDQKLRADDGDPGDRFGASVSMGDLNRLIVGAPGDDDTGLDSGASYEFTLPAGTWFEGAKRVGVSAGDWMGSAADLTLNYSVTGTSNYDYLAQPLTGGLIIWKVDQTPYVNYLVAKDEGIGDRLGVSVSMDLCDVVAGCPGDDSSGENSGAAYVYPTLEGSAALVNGTGINPPIMTTIGGPDLGETWQVDVDATGYPAADQSFLYLYRKFAAAPIVRPYGEILVDLSSQRILVRAESGSGLITHLLNVPNDLTLLGLQASTQVLLRDSIAGTIVTLTNGELVTIGCRSHP